MLITPVEDQSHSGGRIKTDKVDSEVLAPCLCTFQRNQRFSCDNRIHALLAKHGVRHEFSDLFGRAGLEFLKSLELSGADKVILSSELKHLEFLNQELENLSRYIASLSVEMKEVRLLMTIPGVDFYSALVIFQRVEA